MARVVRLTASRPPRNLLGGWPPAPCAVLPAPNQSRGTEASGHGRSSKASARLRQMQQQAQRDMASGALNEQTVNAYFQQHMQKVRARRSLPAALCALCV